MTDFAPERPHPIPGMVDNPEWGVVLTKRAELYMAERARRADPEREPTGGGPVIAIAACIGVAVSIGGYLFGLLF